jgi:hypothetical protein
MGFFHHNIIVMKNFLKHLLFLVDMLDEAIENLHFLGKFQKIRVDKRKRITLPLDLVVVLELKQDLLKILKRKVHNVSYSDIVKDNNIYCYVSEEPVGGEITVFPEIAYVRGRIPDPDKYVKRKLDHYDVDHAYYRLTLKSDAFKGKEVDISTRGNRFAIRLHD